MREFRSPGCASRSPAGQQPAAVVEAEDSIASGICDAPDELRKRGDKPQVSDGAALSADKQASVRVTEPESAWLLGLLSSVRVVSSTIALGRPRAHVYGPPKPAQFCLALALRDALFGLLVELRRGGG
jgi:hypothetical protein